MPTIRLTWDDFNTGSAQEDDIYVYRDTSPLDPGSLPSPLTTLAANTTSYDDTTAGFNQTYYYGVQMSKDTPTLSALATVTFTTDTLKSSTASFTLSGVNATFSVV